MARILCEAEIEDRNCRIFTNDGSTEFVIEWIKTDETIEKVTRIKMQKKGFLCTLGAFFEAAASLDIEIGNDVSDT